MTIMRAIEDEYWSIQYRTQVAGRGVIFWPDDGEGRYDSAESAEEFARKEIQRNRGTGYRDQARLMHVVRRVEYGQPIDIDAAD